MSTTDRLTLCRPGIRKVSILGVDLAAKYSAACWLNDDGAVIRQWDSWGLSETEFISSLLGPFVVPGPEPAPQYIVLEDLPHRLPFSTLIKQVSRLQGRIYDRFERVDCQSQVVWLDPATWRNHHALLRRKGLGPQAVVDSAGLVGYAAPLEELTVRAKGNGGIGVARKVASDYCSAFLIARWALKSLQTWDSIDVPGTSRYGEHQKTQAEGVHQ